MKRLAIIAVTLLAGCVYKGGKVIEGTSLTVGLTVPGTDGALQFNALEYIGGMRIAFAENASVTISRTNSVHNSYFGVIDVDEESVISAKVEPCETTPTAKTDEDAKDGPTGPTDGGCPGAIGSCAPAK